MPRSPPVGPQPRATNYDQAARTAEAPASRDAVNRIASGGGSSADTLHTRLSSLSVTDPALRESIRSDSSDATHARAERRARQTLDSSARGDSRTPARQPTPDTGDAAPFFRRISDLSAAGAPSDSGSEAAVRDFADNSFRTRASTTSERSTVASLDSMTLEPRPWHVTGIFTSLQAVPPDRAMTHEHWSNVMLNHGGQVHSLDDADMEFKYGAWFRRTYRLRRSSCIGLGSTATVYSGEMDGKRVAFKVMNQSKTAPNASLFLDRSVLTELEVHHLLQQMLDPAVCKHLLVILDCQIYPPLHPVFAAIEHNMPKTAPGSTSAAKTGAIELAADNGQEEGDTEMYNSVDAPATSTSEMKFQVIMVSPLCELGGFLKLCQGKLNLPTRSVPIQALRAVVHRLSPRHYKNLVESVGFDMTGVTVDDVVDRFPVDVIVSHLVDKWGTSHRAIMRSSQIPQQWQYILKVQLLLQVCDGLSVLHRVGVVHCDVKLDNVFLAFDDTCRPFRIAAKLGDLGMCRYVEPSRAQPTPAVRAHPGSAGMLSAYTILVKGTPGYCAPEMLEFGRLAPATDIYSMSVLITLALAPESEFVWHEAWIMKLLPRCPQDMSPVLISTLRKGLSFVKEERPTLQELVAALRHELVRLCATVDLDASDLGV